MTLYGPLVRKMKIRSPAGTGSFVTLVHDEFSPSASREIIPGSGANETETIVEHGAFTVQGEVTMYFRDEPSRELIEKCVAEGGVYQDCILQFSNAAAVGGVDHDTWEGQILWSEITGRASKGAVSMITAKFHGTGRWKLGASFTSAA